MRLRPYCKIIEAQNGIDGLVAVEEKSPDLVLSDVMMPGKVRGVYRMQGLILVPGMDGIQFVNTVRETSTISWTPVILLTAKSAEEAQVEGLVGYQRVDLPSAERSSNPPGQGLWRR